MILFPRFFVFFCAVVLWFEDVSASIDDELVEEFSGGDPGMFNRPCLNGSPFEVKKYDDYKDDFEKPAGANEYFLMPVAGKMNCVETGEAFEVERGSKMSLLLRTSSNDSGIIFRWSAMKPDTNINIASKAVNVVNSTKWIPSEITDFQRNNTIKVRLWYTSPEGFLAIDKFRIISNKIKTTTKSPTTTPDSTSTTEATTTTPTENTTDESITSTKVAETTTPILTTTEGSNTSTTDTETTTPIVSTTEGSNSSTTDAETTPIVSTTEGSNSSTTDAQTTPIVTTTEESNSSTTDAATTPIVTTTEGYNTATTDAATTTPIITTTEGSNSSTTAAETTPIVTTTEVSNPSTTDTATTTPIVTTTEGSNSSTTDAATTTPIVSTTEGLNSSTTDAATTTPSDSSTTFPLTSIIPPNLAPQSNSWKIIAIAVISVLVFIILYSIFVTLFALARKMSSPKPVPKMSPGQALPRLQIRRGYARDGNSVIEITSQ